MIIPTNDRSVTCIRYDCVMLVFDYKNSGLKPVMSIGSKLIRIMNQFKDINFETIKILAFHHGLRKCRFTFKPNEKKTTLLFIAQHIIAFSTEICTHFRQFFELTVLSYLKTSDASQIAAVVWDSKKCA